VSADGPKTKHYGDLTLNAPYETKHWKDVWDLTQGDLTLSYTIDMTGLNQPGTWDTFKSWQTWYTQVGLRGEGAPDFNPGPFDEYQGKCGGWMTSDSDNWTDSDGYTEKGNPDPDSIQDLDDKHILQASGGRGEGDYDVLLSDPDTVLDPTIGSFSNYGVWFDRDGVDPWQDNDPDTPAPGGSAVPWAQQDGRKTYNTGGVYRIEITYHAIDDGLGVMFATVNGDPDGEVEPEDVDIPVPQGFVRNNDGTYQYYPAGLSFQGDMKHMQVFAGIWSPSLPAGHDYGYSELSDITVTGYRGTSDPLVADFTYTPDTIYPGDEVQFTDASHGGMPPYAYEWDFGDGTTSTEANPTHAYDTAGEYTVTLTVIPFRCVPKSVTKTITVESPGTGTPGYWMNHPEAWPVDEITIGGVLYTRDEAIALIKASTKKDVTYIMFQALVAAKLNVLMGNDDSCIALTIAAADAWMADYGPVGSGVTGKGTAWREGEPLYWMLDDYNNGLLCAPARD
jgi:chitodextrinase